MRPPLVVRRVHPVLVVCNRGKGEKKTFVNRHDRLDAARQTVGGGSSAVLTLLRRSDGDGLRRELLVKVARVRL